MMQRRGWRDLVLGALVVPGVALALAGCGSGGGTAPTSTVGAVTGTSVSGPPGVVDIEACANDKGNGKALGTIENTGTEPVTYKVDIVFQLADGKTVGKGSADVKGVPPGQRGDWVITATGLGKEGVICRTVGIAGKPAG